MADLRVQLASELIGSIVLEDDPKGLESLEQTVKRSQDNDGVMYEITLSLDWTKKGKAFIQSCYAVGGIEAVVIVNIYVYKRNTRQWAPYYTGQVDMSKYSILEDRISVPIQQVGFQKKTINLFDVDVNLETLQSQSGAALPATPSINLPYHAKKILKGYDSTVTDGSEFAQLDTIMFDFGACEIGPCFRDRDTTVYGQFDNGKINIQELTDTFSYPWGFSPETRNEIYRATEAGLASIHLKSRLKMSIFATQSGSGVDTDIDSPCVSVSLLAGREAKVWFEHRDKLNNVITLTEVGSFATIGVCGGDSVVGDFETFEYNAAPVNIAVGDKIYFYMTLRIYGTYKLGGGELVGRQIHHEVRLEGDPDNTSYQISTSTTFPATTHKTWLIHEALKKLFQYYTDQVDCFKSSFFGRVDSDPAYPEDGPGSLMGIINGRILRDLDNLDMFANADDAVKSLNSLWNVSMGFETIDGIPKVVIEKRSYFYDKNTEIIRLGKVNDLKKEIVLDLYYSQVEIGYPKLDAGEINGIDEFNTVRKYSPPLTQAKNTLTLRSLWKGSGYEIESQRRLQAQTKDSRNDDAVFMTMLQRDGGDFVTERNEHFPIVNNLYDPATAYNLRISPTRNALRHAKDLLAPLWASIVKVYKFTYGEGNYAMESKLDTESEIVSEGQDIAVDAEEQDFIPEKYSFTYPLSEDEFALIKQTPYGYITFEDTLGNEMEGFILQIAHSPVGELGTFSLLKVFRA